MPPYISFQTFTNLLDRLESGGIPHRIDRTYWGAFMSGGVGQQLMLALRFLGLIDADTDEPTAVLERLVDSSQRTEALRELLHDVYRPVFQATDLTRATAGHLEQAFNGEFKVEGDTRRKAITFFTHAAKAAEIELSPFILNKSKTRSVTPKNGRVSRARKPRTQGSTDSSSEASGNGITPVVAPTTGDHKTVRLRNGGTVTITYSVNLFDLVGHDREFVFGLIDRLHEYERVSVQDADVVGDAPIGSESDSIRLR